MTKGNTLEGNISLAHGAGGVAMAELIDHVFVGAFKNPILDRRDDSAVLRVGGAQIAFTTDSFVIDPIFFPGGDIGRLAVCGTVNDLATSGAKPLFLSAAFVIEEGFAISELLRIVRSMSSTALEAGVTIVTGDTKVVPRGAADKVFITTTGIGEIRAGYVPSGANARPGDAVILSGTVADHGIAVMSRREGLMFESEIISDAVPLCGLVDTLLDECPGVKTLRDPTRGGLASTLNEIAAQSNVCIEIDESKVPVAPGTRAACEILGIDPLYVANEGKLVIIVSSDHEDCAIRALHSHPLGQGAVKIGSVQGSPSGRVNMTTPFGSRRILSMVYGEQMPRIC